MKGRFAKRGTLPGDEGYVPPGGGGGATASDDMSMPDDAALDDMAFMGLLTESFGGGAPPLQSPLQWLQAQGH